MARAKAQYSIISVSYWDGDSWVIEPGTYNTRGEAHARLQEVREADFLLPITDSRKYRVMTQTELKRTFGAYWFEHMRTIEAHS